MHIVNFMETYREIVQKNAFGCKICIVTCELLHLFQRSGMEKSVQVQSVDFSKYGMRSWRCAFARQSGWGRDEDGEYSPLLVSGSIVEDILDGGRHNNRDEDRGKPWLDLSDEFWIYSVQGGVSLGEDCSCWEAHQWRWRQRKTWPWLSDEVWIHSPLLFSGESRSWWELLLLIVGSLAFLVIFFKFGQFRHFWLFCIFGNISSWW